MCTFREAVGMERWGKVAECGCVKGGEWGGAVVEEEEWEEMVLSESLRVVSSESNLLLCVCVCVRAMEEGRAVGIERNGGKNTVNIHNVVHFHF